MAIANEVGALLQSLNLGTLTGTPRTLFLENLPDTPDACGAVFSSGGSSPAGGFGVTGIKFEYPNVLVRFRGAKDDVVGPLTKAQTAYRGMHLVGVTLSGVRYLKLTPLQPPYVYERDSKGRTTWAFNAASEKELSPS